MDFTIKQGDDRSALKSYLYNASGKVVDLTGTTVKFILSDQTARLLNKDAIIKNATEGIIWVQFEKIDLENISGLCRAEIKVTFPDGKVETYPNNGYIKVNVVKSL